LGLCLDGGFNRSSQHLDDGGADGQADWRDDSVDGKVRDEVAGEAFADAGAPYPKIGYVDPSYLRTVTSAANRNGSLDLRRGGLPLDPGPMETSAVRYWSDII
jgi:hypothetical protein